MMKMADQISYRFMILILLLTLTTVSAQTLNFRTSVVGFESGMTLSAGAYKSYASTFLMLQKRKSTRIFRPTQESKIYTWLLSHLYKPRYLVLQSTFFPLACGSSQIETYHPRIFNRFEFMGMNLLKSVGAGYEEPYAVSMLFGNFALFGYRYHDENNRMRIRQSGSALAGMMITAGHLHIHDNIRVDDRWWHLELILTGQLKEPLIRNLEWNFRVGAKIHETPLAPDVLIFVLHRSHTEWNFRKFSILRNSRIHYEFHIPIGDDWGRLPFTIRQHLSYGKKFPFKLWGRFWALRLGGGILWEYTRLFDSENRGFEQKESSHISWLIQPSIEF
jgi:hypothetical protein